MEQLTPYRPSPRAVTWLARGNSVSKFFEVPLAHESGFPSFKFGGRKEAGFPSFCLLTFMFFKHLFWCFSLLVVVRSLALLSTVLVRFGISRVSVLLTPVLVIKKRFYPRPRPSRQRRTTQRRPRAMQVARPFQSLNWPAPDYLEKGSHFPSSDVGRFRAPVHGCSFTGL